ncbi:unnamed protein product, partial [Discosporangium mesarthrocarpum]
MDFVQQLPPGVGTLVGRSVPRLEDREMLRGEATFLDDIHLPDETHAVFVRSVDAHANIVSIETDAARASVGVIDVLTGEDLSADGIGGVPWEVRPVSEKISADSTVPAGDPSIARPQPAMPADRAMFVGQIVSMVIADTLAAARDAAEKIVI